MVLSEGDNGSPALFWHALSTESRLKTTRQNKVGERGSKQATRNAPRGACTVHATQTITITKHKERRARGRSFLPYDGWLALPLTR